MSTLRKKHVTYIPSVLPLQACRIANNAMAEVVDRYPDRLIGVALIPTSTEEVRPSLPTNHCFPIQGTWHGAVTLAVLQYGRS